MKKYAPFLITGVLSAALAVIVVLMTIPQSNESLSIDNRAVLTNFSSVPLANPSANTVLPDLVKASNLAKQAVVYIESRKSTTAGYFGRRNYGGSTGSGVVISSDGYIATNHHVIGEGDEIAVLLEDGREFQAKLIGSDPSTDLALLKIDVKNLPSLTFGDSDSLMVGEWVLAIGNPFRLYSTVTAGIVSAMGRNINILDEGGIETFIQTDAAVNPGNSGGALVNAHGQLMGINTAIMTFSGQYEGFSFAVPANLARKVLEDLRKFGASKRGWLGVVIRPVDSQVAGKAGLNTVSGVVIETVNTGSAAAAAGLQAGDIVTSIDGKRILSSPDFMGKIGQHHPGDQLRFSIIRDRKMKDVIVRLSESRNGTLADNKPALSAEIMLADIGIHVRNLNESEDARLPKTGVIVSHIEEGSQIDAVNMEEKFVITRLNGISTPNVDILKQELKKAGNTLYFQGYYEDYPGDFAYHIAVK